VEARKGRVDDFRRIAKNIQKTHGSVGRVKSVDVDGAFRLCSPRTMSCTQDREVSCEEVEVS
jgi:hypothetical protein